MIIAAWPPTALAAVARASRRGGTSAGSIDCIAGASITFATDSTNTSPRMVQTSLWCSSVSAVSATIASHSIS